MLFVYFFVFKQKTAYEMRISDWSSDVCSSDLSCVPSGWVCLFASRPMKLRESNARIHSPAIPRIVRPRVERGWKATTKPSLCRRSAGRGGRGPEKVAGRERYTVDRGQDRACLYRSPGGA